MAERANRFSRAVDSRASRAPAASPAGEAGGPQEPKPRAKKKPRGATARRTDPVRMTIDLTPPEYTRMKHVLLAVAADADRPTLTAAAMWRALLAEVGEDPALVARVAERIAASAE